jgi:hypothetical protein
MGILAIWFALRREGGSRHADTLRGALPWKGGSVGVQEVGYVLTSSTLTTTGIHSTELQLARRGSDVVVVVSVAVACWRFSHSSSEAFEGGRS